MIAGAIETWLVTSSLFAIGWSLLSFIVNFLTLTNLPTILFMIFLVWGLLYLLLFYRKEGNHETNTSVRSR